MKLPLQYIEKKASFGLLILLTFSYLYHAKSKDMVNIQEEIWKDVIGHSGAYKVSNLGNVKSFKYKADGHMLKPFLTGDKPHRRYYTVMLGKTDASKAIKRKVHHLVAECFLEPPAREGMIVDHINNISTDNRAVNLQRIMPRENLTKDRARKSKYPGVGWLPKQKKWKAVIQINKELKYLGWSDSEEEAGKLYQDAIKQYNL